MKKSLKISLVTLMGICAFPLQSFALRQDVGVKVKGDNVISVVTTISSDINIDVENKTTNEAYIELQNKSSLPINVKITDIEALTENAPNTFIDADEYLSNAGIDDTKTKIGFRISTDGSSNWQAIKPSTEINLGVIASTKGFGGMYNDITETLNTENQITFIPYDPYYTEYGNYNSETYSQGREIYRLHVENGYAWTDVDLSFYYGITMVVGLSDDSYDRHPIQDLGVDGINVALLNGSRGVSYIEVFMDGLEDPTKISSFSAIATYTASDGTNKGASTQFLGYKVRKEMTYNQETHQMEEVENGEVYGTSYFYSIDLDTENIRLQYASDPMYINCQINMTKASNGETITIKDILANKNLN